MSFCLWLRVAAAGFAFALGAAFGLLEEGGEDTEEGDEERENKEGEAHRAPKGDVSGGAGLLGDVREGDAAGDQREQKQGGGEDEEIASHEVAVG